MEEINVQQVEHSNFKLSHNADHNHHSRALLYGIGAFLIMIISLVVGYYLGIEKTNSQVAGVSTLYKTASQN